MPFQPSTENEAYAGMLCEHVERLVGRLREFPPDRWDWTPSPSAPTARILAAHALQWLQCDRQHIAEPDASRHPRVPEPPSHPQAMCDALLAEAVRWRQLILSLTPEQLDEPRFLFGYDDPLNVRALVCHMVKNVTYKHGQLATLYFALGLDGMEPYHSPLPNPEYEACFGPANGEAE